MPLYGNELDRTTNPFEASLGRVVKLVQAGRLRRSRGARAGRPRRRHAPARRPRPCATAASPATATRCCRAPDDVRRPARRSRSAARCRRRWAPPIAMAYVPPGPCRTRYDAGRRDPRRPGRRGGRAAAVLHAPGLRSRRPPSTPAVIAPNRRGRDRDAKDGGARLMVPDDLRFTKEHEWVRVEGDEATVGITQYAADQLGDIVFVELPAVGRALEQFATFGVVESVKAVSDLFAPVAGEVVGVNDALADTARARQRRAVRRRLDGPGPPRRPGAGRRPPRRRRLRAAGRRGLIRCRTAPTSPTTGRGCSRRSAWRRSTTCSRTSRRRSDREPAADRSRRSPSSSSPRGSPASPRATASTSRASSARAPTATGRRPRSTSCCSAASGTRPTRRTSPRSARARSRASTSTSRCSRS